MSKIKMLILVSAIVAMSFTVAVAGKMLNLPEEVHLNFMRSEEKLARDVYLTLAEMYPDQPVFKNIATRSEQAHTDTMRDMTIDSSSGEWA